LLRERARAEKEEKNDDENEYDDDEYSDEDDYDEDDVEDDGPHACAGGDARQLREMASAGTLLRQALRTASQKESAFNAGKNF
jgi:hypothetical protein